MKIIECPRDAMQGLNGFIPTTRKIDYLNQLLEVGFDTIDFGSFVSPKAIPQMRDTSEVVKHLEWKTSQSGLLAIIANVRGAQEASAFEGIRYLGFPMSISETFQKRNTNKSIPEALNELEQIGEICRESGKKLVTYISMGFGNPYGDPYDVDIVDQFVGLLITLNCKIISLADTVGAAESQQIFSLFDRLSTRYPGVELGAHLHATPDTAQSKIKAAFEAGCKRFDGALKGFGGCPMARNELVGNVATELIIEFLQEQRVQTTIDQKKLGDALKMAAEIFPKS